MKHPTKKKRIENAADTAPISMNGNVLEEVNYIYLQKAINMEKEGMLRNIKKNKFGVYCIWQIE